MEKVRLTRELSVKTVDKDWTKQLTEIRMRIAEVEAKLYKKEVVTEQLHTKTTVVTHVEDPRAAELRSQIEQVKADNSTLNQKITFHTQRMTQEDLYDVSLSGLRKNLQGGSMRPSNPAKSPTTRPQGGSGLPGVTGGRTETTVSSSKVTGNVAGGSKVTTSQVTGGSKVVGGSSTVKSGVATSQVVGGKATGSKVVGGTSTGMSGMTAGMTVSGTAGSRVQGGQVVGGGASGMMVSGGASGMRVAGQTSSMTTQNMTVTSSSQQWQSSSSNVRRA